MKDEVVGLCVLCPMDLGEGEYFLYLTERRGDGAEFRTWIPCCESAAPKPARPYPVWTFRRRPGSRLEVWPSLWDKGRGFHNAGRWEVRYVEVSASVESLDVIRLHGRLNSGSRVERLRLLIRLRRRGVLV